MPSIVAMSVWQGLPASVIIFLAGLQAIPHEYYDAASVDGAGRWSRFRNVTLPLLTPSIFFTGVLSLIGAFQVFDQVYVMASPGKPGEGDDHARLLHLRGGLPQLQDGLRERPRHGSCSSSWRRRRSSTSGRRVAGCTTSEAAR